MKPRRCLKWAAGLIACLAAGGVVPTEQGVRLEKIEALLLNGDWQAVMEECERYDPRELGSFPVVRAIMGHACLALNRNNESLRCFAPISLLPADRRAWLTWASEFAEMHRKEAVAHYLKGDALARNEDWSQARAAFDEALRVKKDFSLALNARGVVQYALGNASAARADFSRAIEVQADLADAHASLGALNFHRRALRGMQRSYEKSISISKDFVLALNGLGCVAYGEQRYEDARKHFDAIPANSALSPLATSNAVATELGRLARTLNKARDAGMSVNRVEIQVDGRQSALLYESDSEYPEPVYRVPAPGGGWFIIGVSGVIYKYIPPSEAGGSGDEGQGETGGREGENDTRVSNATPRGAREGGYGQPVYKVPAPGGGWYIIGADGTIIEYIPPERPGDEDDREGGTMNMNPATVVPPWLVGDPGAVGGPLAPVGSPFVPEPPYVFFTPDAAGQLATINTGVEQRFDRAMASPAGAPLPPGGVESRGIKTIRTSTGRWSVHVVFGLLYHVPAEPASQQMKPADADR